MADRRSGYSPGQAGAARLVQSPGNKKAGPKEDWQYKTSFGELHEEFPELVDKSGKGWLYRHVHKLCSFVKAHSDLVSSPAYNSCLDLRKDFDKAWQTKVTQMQVPLFHRETKGGWVLRFDDVLAAAKEQGPLRNYDVPLAEESLAQLRELTPKGVPDTVLPTLVRYYLAHRQPDTEWVVLPVANLDAYFGTTSFSHTWLKELPEELILRDWKRKDPCRYLVPENLH